MGKLLTALGNPPVCTSRAFQKYLAACLRFYEDIVANSTRATVYHFSTSGNDTTGDGSANAPFQTLAKAQALHDAWSQSSAGIEFRFKRGDTWRKEAGLNFTKSYITVADYGDSALAKPLFTYFETPYSAWSNSTARTDAFTNTYSVNQSGTVVWVREANCNSEQYILQKKSSIAEVDATRGSWAVVSGVLYLHPRDGTAPATSGRSYEAVLANTAGGIYMRGVNCIVKRVRVDGYSAGHNDEPYPIIANAGDGVFYECEAYYGGYHEIGAVGTATDYGFIRCRAGMDTVTAATGGTVFVSYNSSGNHEAFFYECVTVAGTLKQAPRTAGTGGWGQPIYGHAGANTCALQIAWRCKSLPGDYQPAACSYFTNVPSWTDIANCRAFQVEDEYLTQFRQASMGDTSQAFGMYATAVHNIRLNSLVRIARNESNLLGSDTPVSSDFGGAGYAINTRFEILNAVPLTNINRTVYLVQSPGGLTSKFHFCDFVFGGVGRQKYTLCYLTDAIPSDPAYKTTAEAKNCRFLLNEPKSTFSPGLNNDADKMVANAYSGRTHATTQNNAYSNDALAVKADPQAGNVLVTPQSITGYSLQFDRLWRPRVLGVAGSIEETSDPIGLTESEAIVLSHVLGRL
ncbi:hypothetical protein SH501x_001408 [Pirellulaceae bacterium SH501]